MTLNAFKRFFRLWLRLLGESLIRPPRRIGLRRTAVLLVLFPALALLCTLHAVFFFLDDLFFPAYKKIRIQRPLFIVGVPRSGTTFLHRLLAADKRRFTTYRLWELIFAPSILERKLVLVGAQLDRICGGPLAHVVQRINRTAFGDLADVHPVALDSPEEDYMLFFPLFACFLIVLVFPWSKEIWQLSDFDRALSEREKATIMRYYKACIRRHLFVRGAHKRLLSKNPSFTSMVATLGRHFPDCQIVYTARTPLRVVPSILSAMDQGLEAFASGSDKAVFHRRLLDMLTRYFYYSHDVVTQMPANRHARVTIEQLRSDTRGSLERLYARLDMKMDSGFRDHLTAQARSAKAYKSRHRYSLNQFGLDPDAVYHRFQAVFERYDYPRPDSAHINQASPSHAGYLKDRSAGQLRIVFISDAIMNRNGVGTYYRDLTDQIDDLFQRVDLICPQLDSPDGHEGLSIPLPGDATQRLVMPRIGSLWHRLRRIDPQVVVAATPGAYGLMGAIYAKRHGLPLVAGYHTAYDQLTDLYWQGPVGRGVSALLRFWNDCFFKTADVTVANNRDLLALAKRTGARNTRLVGTPIARSFLEVPIKPLSPTPSRVLFAGRLSAEKNVPDILAACEALSDCQFVIAGDGPLRPDVERTARKRPNLTYLGWVPHQRIQDLLDETDLFVLPSKTEAFGTVALEAMSRGRLVLVSSACGILQWQELAPGLMRIQPGHSLSQAIRWVFAQGADELNQIAQIAVQASRKQNRNTMVTWREVLRQQVTNPLTHG